MNRPVSVTVICWLLILFAFASVVPVLITLRVIEENATFPLTSRTYATLPIIAVFNITIQLVMAIGMLKREDWARLVFLWATPLSILAGLIWGVIGTGMGSGPGSAVKAVLYLVCLWFLTRPHVVAWFKREARVGTH
ncbi:hypothetical protein ACFL6M_06480 [Candidatus Eisenbacteria bacterium]|uniref:DUF2569 domain-containing protein n=1 Tax=Eiseniibacteriota bacterium TaxID=2212470 RepID=A0ABV6YM25_UNCEI